MFMRDGLHLRGKGASVFTSDLLGTVDTGSIKNIFGGRCYSILGNVNRNLGVNNKIGDTVIGTTINEKHFGVKISGDVKVSEHCGIAASKGNQIPGLTRNIIYKEYLLIIPLNKAIVRPHLEYCFQAWIPSRKMDTDTLDQIQRRATKMIPKLRYL